MHQSLHEGSSSVGTRCNYCWLTLGIMLYCNCLFQRYDKVAGKRKFTCMAINNVEVILTSSFRGRGLTSLVRWSLKTKRQIHAKGTWGACSRARQLLLWHCFQYEDISHYQSGPFIKEIRYFFHRCPDAHTPLYITCLSITEVFLTPGALGSRISLNRPAANTIVTFQKRKEVSMSAFHWR